MTGASYELSCVDHFTAGAVGEPGQRVFYLQAAQGEHLVTLRLEKQQVAALCEHLAAMMADLPEVAAEPGHGAGLRAPVDAAWVVGAMGVAYEQAEDQILVVAEEMSAEPVDDDAFDDVFDVIGDQVGTARFHIPRGLVPAFVAHGLAVIGAGRPTCELCQGPMDPSGHACPRLN
jgi:uncharacterized repeat protein (TIGR03847 family)